MGGIIPRKLKEQVICDWIQGLRRDKIAQKYGIGVGTVTKIVQEPCQQAEFSDMPLFRHLALKLKENGLEPAYLALAIRIKKIMEENDMNVNHFDRIISEIATYRYLHKLSLDGLIKSGMEAIMLQEIFGIPVVSIPKRIVQLKKDLDDLADQVRKKLDRKRELEREILECEKYISELRKTEGEVKASIDSLDKKDHELEEEDDKAINRLEVEFFFKTAEENYDWAVSEPGIDLKRLLLDIFKHPSEYGVELRKSNEIYYRMKKELYI